MVETGGLRQFLREDYCTSKTDTIVFVSIGLEIYLNMLSFENLL